ncbi:hypothetical protein GQ53DRAFT_752783 [Thozetella sp. PMI_491]|nr:hypothetical protein GQ53DRAFT_752783 [Thozetella sp. PMI_491]
MQRIRQTLARLTSSSRSTKPSKVDNAKRHDHLNVGGRKSMSASRAGSKSDASLSLSRADTATLCDEPSDPAKLPPKGMCCLLDDSNDDENGVDIILVHGFNGHREESWTKSGVCWPRDLLGQDIPGVRIISWGWWLNFPDPAVFTQIADKSPFGDLFLEDIVMFYKTRGMNRSVIFIGHDFGGLIIKQALSTAAISRIYGNGVHAELGTIYARTIGVIFLGTPHIATSGHTLGETVADALHISPQRPTPALLGWLSEQSELLMKIHEDFVLFTRDIPVVCIRETRPTRDGSMIPRESASYKGGMNLTVDSIQADHFDMIKFARRTDPGYFQILGHISKLSQDPGATDLEEAKEQRNREILNALYFEGMTEKENRIKVDDSFRHTCDQVLSAKGSDDSASPFYSWLLAKDPIFWMSGKAGSGKSTMMKHAFHDKETRDRLEQWAQSSGGTLMMISVYLDDSGSHLKRSHEGIIRTLLHQILSKRPELTAVAFPSFFVGPWPPLTQFNTTVNLTQAFWSIFTHEASRLRLVIFMDGLDAFRLEEGDGQLDVLPGTGVRDGDENDSDSDSEASKNPAHAQWLDASRKAIAGLVESMSDQAHTKFCISSREVTILEEAFSRFPRLRVHTQSEEAIARYCATRLMEDAPNLADAKSLCLEVASRSNGHVLYARLVMDMLLEGSMKSIRPTLNSLPSRLGGSKGLYMYMLRRLGPERRRGAARIFQLMLRAQLPLTLITLCFSEQGYLNSKGGLRTVDGGAQSMTTQDIKEMCEQMEERLNECCLQLVECEGQPLQPGHRVIFMHQTVKEFAARADIWKKLGQSACFESNLDMDLCLLSSYIRHIQCFPSIRLFVMVWPDNRARLLPEVWLLIATALRYAGRVDSELKGDPVRTAHYLDLIDELDATCQHAWVTALQTYQPFLEDNDWTESKCPALCRAHWAGFEPMETGKSPKRSEFLSLAIQANLVNYVSARLGTFLQGNDEETKLAKLQGLLRIAVCPRADGISASAEYMTDYRDFHRDMPDTAFLDMLFRHGLNMSSPASSKIWVKAVKGGAQYFSRQSSAAMARLTKAETSAGAHSNSSLALQNNRDRWIAAIKVMLSRGADPYISVRTGGNSMRDDGSSIESKSAIEIVRDTLQSELEYAVDMSQMENLANKFNRL